MWRFLIPSLLLYVIGAFSLFGIEPSLLSDHILFMGIALIIYFVLRKTTVAFFRRNVLFFYLLFVVLLFITLFFGLEIKGSRSWISLYFFNFQPSELFKVFFIVFMAFFLSRYQSMLNNILVYVLLLIFYAVPVFVIFKQPDFGSAAIISFIFFAMALFSRIPRVYIVSTIACVMISFPFLWSFYLADYQKLRITSFIDPAATTEGAYNMIQAIITVGSGQIFGRGLGLGKQTSLFFLPEDHTDFAYSSLVEQFGFIGGITVIALYIVMCVFLARRAFQYYQKRDDETSHFFFLYTLGIFTFLIVQVFVNVGMNMGMLPITGITLPLISYGGSSLVTWMVGLAFIPPKKDR